MSEGILASTVPDYSWARAALKCYLLWLPSSGRIELPPWTIGLDAVSLAHAIKRAASGTDVGGN